MARAVHVGDLNEGLQLVTSSPDLGSYTPEEKKLFDKLITESNATGLLLLKRDKSEAEWNNLYHSFEKGNKGQYQRVVDDLYHKGESMVRDYVDIINEAVAASEDIETHLEEMGELRPLVEERVCNGAAMAMRAA